MKLQHLGLILSLVLSLSASEAFGSTSMTGKALVEYQRGLVDIRGSDTPIVVLLEELSHKAGIHIFLFDSIENERFPNQIVQKDLDNALRILLKGHNYAVLYNHEKETPATHGSRDKQPQFPVFERIGVTLLKQNSDSKTDLAFLSRQQAPGSGNFRNPPYKGSSPAGDLPYTASGQADIPGEPVGGSGKGRNPLSRHPETNADSRGAGTYGDPPPESSSAGNHTAQAAGSTYTSYAGGAAGTLPAGEDPSYETASDSQYPVYPNSYSQGAHGPGSREDYIRNQIAYLEHRIAEGLSDADYERSKAFRDERYLTHDKEKVEFLKKSLDQH